MENGVGSVDDSAALLGKEVIESEVLDSRIEERVASGSDESKESEADEVFEDSIGAETPTVYQEDVVVSRDDNIEKKTAEVDASVDAETEVETFEEAIGVSTAVGNHEEELEMVNEGKLEGVVGEEPVVEAAVPEACEGERTAEEVVGGELIEMEVDASRTGREDAGKEATDDTAVNDMEMPKDEDDVDQKSGVVLEVHQNGVSDVVYLEESLVHVDDGDVNKERLQVDGKSNTWGAQLVSRVDSESSQEVELESTGDSSQQGGKTEDLKTLNTLDTGYVNEKTWESEEALSSELGVHTVEEPKDDSIKLNAESKDDENRKLKGEAPPHPIPLLQANESGELKEEADLGLDGRKERSEEPKSTSATTDSNIDGTRQDPEDELNSFMQGEIVSLGAQKSSPVEDTVLENEKNIVSNASDLRVKNVEASQVPQHADRDVEISKSVAEVPDNRGEQDLEVKQSTQKNAKVKIKPVANIPPSSQKSSNSTPPPAHPAGLGRAAPLLEPAPRVVQQPRANGALDQTQSQLIDDVQNGEAEEYDETREKLQMIRVKFLRLAHRLGQTPHNVVVAQVLYRLGLAEQLRGRSGGRVAAFSFDRASAMAEQLEAAGQEPLDFSCTIMVLGKTGVGKSATINSIFDEIKFGTDAFQLGTKRVQDVVGTVQGIKVRVIDTPGLLPSWSDQHQNEKILRSVKQVMKKTPPDIVLYLDRLDMQSRDFGDFSLLRTITEIFGPSIWFNAIVVLTHAASAPPEGPNGTATSYDMFVTQRSHVVQQAIRQAAGDMRLMNPVSLVENHSACRTNRAGQRVLPNGQVWKPHLLLLSFASKILAEANALLKLQDGPPGTPFTTRIKSPPLPVLLSSLLQSRPQLKLPEEQFGDDDTIEDELDESSDSDDEFEFDELPPFKPLTKAQLAKLSKAQKKAYHDELEYREKLFMKKQLKEEKRRRKMMKKMAASAKDFASEFGENVEEESGGTASVPVPMQDLALPASFDADYPTHRYRCLDSPNQWVVRPVLDTHGWDHDIGYEGVNVERLFVLKQEIPVSFSGQFTKDKKDSTLQMELASSLKHGEGKTSLGLDMQTLGKDIAYTVRGETRFSNRRRNKATAGLSATLLGDALSAGVKVEDKLIVNKQFRMVLSGGAMTGRGDVAYGGSLEATLRDKDHPLGRFLLTLGLSVMDWHGDLAIGGNLQSQLPIGRSTNLIARVNLNNRGSGNVSVRLNSSEQLQIALVALVPLLRKIVGYPQQLQYGQ